MEEYDLVAEKDRNGTGKEVVERLERRVIDELRGEQENEVQADAVNNKGWMVVEKEEEVEEVEKVEGGIMDEEG